MLAGEIANSEALPAGPSVTLAFLFAGIGCALSGLSFAELASRIHQDGSSYAYAYVTLGEVFAFVAGCCLTLGAYRARACLRMYVCGWPSPGAPCLS